MLRTEGLPPLGEASPSGLVAAFCLGRGEGGPGEGCECVCHEVMMWAYHADGAAWRTCDVLYVRRVIATAFKDLNPVTYIK